MFFFGFLPFLSADRLKLEVDATSGTGLSISPESSLHGVGESLGSEVGKSIGSGVRESPGQELVYL